MLSAHLFLAIADSICTLFCVHSTGNPVVGQALGPGPGVEAHQPVWSEAAHQPVSFLAHLAKPQFQGPTTLSPNPYTPPRPCNLIPAHHQGPATLSPEHHPDRSL